MRVEGEYIVFGRHYDIWIKLLDTPARLKGWIDQLSEKNWFTLQDKEQMIKACEEYFGYDYDHWVSK